MIALTWISGEHPLTAATWALLLATFFMFFATIFLYLDGRGKRKEEQAGRQGEDRLKAKRSQTRAHVEFARRESSPHIFVLCHNLGTDPIIIDKLSVGVEESSTPMREISIGPYIVTPGSYLAVGIDCTEMLTRSNMLHRGTITFRVRRATGCWTTDPARFDFCSDGTGGYRWSLGGPENKKIEMRQPPILPDEDTWPMVRVGASNEVEPRQQVL